MQGIYDRLVAHLEATAWFETVEDLQRHPVEAVYKRAILLLERHYPMDDGNEQGEDEQTEI